MGGQRIKRIERQMENDILHNNVKCRQSSQDRNKQANARESRGREKGAGQEKKK